MTATHLHLVLNHLPVVGALFGGALFVVALASRAPRFQRVALAFLLVSALAAIAVYGTGESAEDAVEHLPGVSEAAIERHEDAAKVAFVAMEILGGLALLGLVAFWWAPTLPATFAALVLVAVMSASALVTWTGYLGGQIRHTEISAAANANVVHTDKGSRRHDRDD